MIKLNLGCGGRPLIDYINVDLNSLDELKKRYPTSKFPEGVKIFNYDIFSLPYQDNTVDEIFTDSLVEHFSFAEEPKFYREMKRVLKPGGIFTFSTPDFEDAVKLWLKAKDDWREFYRNDDEAIQQTHWFGTYTYGTENRWGYLTAMLFGNQNGIGQFHKNCYTEGKIRAMMNYLGFDVIELSRFRWKNDRDLMIKTIARKKL
jgi:predicted SAM-dependent methyltransferase